MQEYESASIHFLHFDADRFPAEEGSGSCGKLNCNVVMASRVLDCMSVACGTDTDKEHVGVRGLPSNEAKRVHGWPY